MTEEQTKTAEEQKEAASQTASKQQQEEVKKDSKKEATTEEKTEKKNEKKGLFGKKDNQELTKLTEENKALQDKVLRVTAEMQNMRRRMEEEKNNLLKYEGEDFIKKILPIVDNFERAIKMDDTNLEDEVSKFLSGFKMIYGNLNSVLQSCEICEIKALNQAFDPNSMEAVMTEDVEGMEPNIVVDVLQKGYTYKGKVIRHAMVKVSK